MDEGLLRLRLWEGFAVLQTLLGGHAGAGAVIEREGMKASVVPNAPDSPTLNAAVAIAPHQAVAHLDELARRYADARVRRWGVWVDGGAADARRALLRAGLRVTTSAPGMGAALDGLDELDGLDRAAPTTPRRTDLATVGRVNDAAYGNYDARLERTLTPLPHDVLRAYRADLDGEPAAVALALHHADDCGVSFVATIPRARRRRLATAVMSQLLRDARAHGCRTTTLQATDVGRELYARLGYRRLCDMELWERRP